MRNEHQTFFSATKILLPVDFSPSSDIAFEAAAGLAEQFHAGIHLVHIIPEIPDWNGSDFFPETEVLQERKQTIEEKLEAYANKLVSKGVLATVSIEEGNDIVGRLMRVIEREKADLLVISTHGLSGWHPLIFGSIAEQVIKQATCTLLLLRSAQPLSDVQDRSMDSIAHAVVPLVHGTEPPKATALEEDKLEQEQLDRVADELAEQGGRTEQQYDQSHPMFTK